MKCAALVCHSQMDSGGKTRRINGSPLWQTKHLLLKQSSNWLNATVKRTDAQTINATAGNQAWIAPFNHCSCCDSDDPCENACEDTDALKIEYDLKDSDSDE